MTPPLRPLPAALPGFRWLRDPARGTTVALHPSGFWFECSDDVLDIVDEAEAIAWAVQGALNAGATGVHVVEVTLHDSGEYSAGGMRAVR